MCDTLTQNVLSDSEESVNLDNAASSIGEISFTTEFDDLMRSYRPLRTELIKSEAIFLDFVEQVKPMYVQLFESLEECKRLNGMLDMKTAELNTKTEQLNIKTEEVTDLEHKLLAARKLLDKEKQKTKHARREQTELASHIKLVRDIIFKDKRASDRLSIDEMRQKLSFLHNNNLPSDWELSSANGHHLQLSDIKEINSTGSILTDFSYSRSEGDLDSSALKGPTTWKKHRASTGGVPEPAIKKRRSSEHKAVEGEAYLSTSPGNQIFESCSRESSPKSEHRLNTREHCFQRKTLVMPETCGPCEKKISFAKTAVKCKACKAICHLECKDDLPLPCIPQVNTPNQRNGLGAIGDYTPTTPPMVPAILIHCINEVERRGLTEVGIYRIPGAERDVKALKERFLKGKGSPCLNQIDIHVICGTVKDFLRNLRESIVTYGLWKKFVQAAEARDPIDIQPALYQAISELPQPNRDTLAYMILHLQKVAEARVCKMDVSNLAKIFGPTIVGYSSEDPNPHTLLDELVQHNNVMEHLIRIPSDYWTSFINVERTCPPSKLQQTPSTDSLLRPIGSKGLFTPRSNVSRKRQKFFPSPKHMH